MTTQQLTARRKRAAFVRSRLIEQAQLAFDGNNFNLAYRYVERAERMASVFINFLRAEEDSIFGTH